MRIVDFGEEGFYFREIAARVQRSIFRVIGVRKQCTDEHRATRKNGSVLRRVTPMHDDRHIVCIVLKNSIASYRQFSAHWSKDIRVLLSASSVRRRTL